ncbi:Zinc finger protein 26 [Nymphon striatum]|nr:Zinc finger protein 26 [Nymphon striatum]
MTDCGMTPVHLDLDSAPEYLIKLAKGIVVAIKRCGCRIYNNIWFGNSNCDMDHVDWCRTTIKKEPGVEIENYTEAASSPDWLSIEIKTPIKTIKEENENSPRGVIDDCEGSPEEIVEHEHIDEDFNEKTCKDIIDADFSNRFDANDGDLFLNYPKTKFSLKEQKDLLTNVNTYKCNLCHNCFPDRSQIAKHTCSRTDDAIEWKFRIASSLGIALFSSAAACVKTGTISNLQMDSRSSETTEIQKLNRQKNAEKVRKWREKQKLNTEANEKLKKKDRHRKTEDRLRKRKEAEKCTAKLEKLRKQKREEMKRYHEKYKSTLPKTPTKRAEVVKKLIQSPTISKILTKEGLIVSPECKRELEIADDMVRLILTFQIDWTTWTRPTEDIYHPRNSNYNMDLVDLRRTTIKREPGVEIENYSESASSPDWLSVEIKTIKDENENSPSGVIDNCDGRSPQEIVEHEHIDEDFNEKTCKDIMDSNFSNRFDENAGDLTKNNLKTNVRFKEQKIQFINVNTFKCNICHKCFLDNSQFVKHVCLHSEEKPFECDICHKCFARKSSMTKHLRLHTKQKSFECNICHKLFARRDYLIQHSRTHTKEKPFECNVCHKCFADRSNMKTHYRIHTKLKTKEKPFECNVCNKRFARIEYLKQHSCTPTKRKPFECNVCHKLFDTMCGITNHLRTHTKEKPFECNICHKRFTQSSSRTVHLRIHTNEKPFECSICHKCFARKNSMTKHLRIHTKEKPFECSVCHKCFSQSSHMRAHLRKHTKEKPFECNVCHKGFAQSSNMRTHYRTHTKPKPFDCKV